MTRLGIFVLWTGVRAGEVPGCTWDDINGDWLQVRGAMTWRRSFSPILGTPPGWSGKTQRSREIQLGGRVLDALRQQRTLVESVLQAGRTSPEVGHFIFPSWRGRTPWATPQDLRNRWGRFLCELGLGEGGCDSSLYALRMTHAVELLRRGVSPGIVAERLGLRAETLLRMLLGRRSNLGLRLLAHEGD